MLGSNTTFQEGRFIIKEGELQTSQPIATCSKGLWKNHKNKQMNVYIEDKFSKFITDSEKWHESQHFLENRKNGTCRNRKWICVITDIITSSLTRTK